MTYDQPMRLLCYTNGLLYAVNAMLWFAYAHSPLMGAVSVLACAGSFYAASRHDY